ncbi:hypothetical protein ACWGRX_21050, partial [Bosea sp. NPDC055594]
YGSQIALTLQSKSDEFTTTLGASDAQLRALFDEKGNGMISALGQRGAMIAHTLQSKSDALAAALGTSTEELRTLLDERGGSVISTLDQRGAQIAQTLDTKSGELAATLGARTEELRALFAQTGGGMIEALSQKGEAIASEVANVGEAVVRTLTSRGSSIIEGLRERGADIAGALETASSQLRETLESGTSQSVEALLKTNEQLRGELGGMLGRLGEANKLMQQIVTGANKNLVAIEGSLSGRVEELQNVLSSVVEETGRASMQVAGQIEALKGFSEGTLRETAGLISRIDEQGSSMTEATQTNAAALNAVAARLEQVEARVGNALADRKEALEHLHGLIATRTDDIEQITRSFSSTLDESLSAAETRTRQIGGVLSESAETTTNAITAQFDTIRAASGRERERITQALRASYEQVVNEVGAEIAKVTERFQSAAEDMRTMSAEIQQELEATRSELKRGVLDLPRETQESTAAMRRVVADQIKALNELTEIVTRSGRSSDVARPSSDAAGRRAAAGAASAPAQVVATVPSPRMPALMEPLRASIDPTPEPARPEPARSPAAEPVRQEVARTEAVRRQPEPAPAKSGWLSDLLNRASRDDRAPETPKPTAHSIEKLDSLSVDIARMIDHDAAVELWDRYKRGERNVFTRRLYTLQGQQTFDEIRRKYRRDAEFKETVDRYIEEFERLLGEAAKDDRDSMVAKTYLTSETGKVYTMLAHASGRFE